MRELTRKNHGTDIQTVAATDQESLASWREKTRARDTKEQDNETRDKDTDTRDKDTDTRDKDTGMEGTQP